MIHDDFLQLVRLGIGLSATSISGEIEWTAIDVLAARQGLLPIIVDGVEKLPEGLRPAKSILLQWIGSVMQSESKYKTQYSAACEIADLYARHGIITYVLKGIVISECYPKPEHRCSVDLDCFLLPLEGNNEVWEKGNKLIEDAGFIVRRDYYKNSTFLLPVLMVENHLFLTPFRGDRRMTRLEKWFQLVLRKDRRLDPINETNLHRPPVIVSALFLIEHSYSHFLNEGLTWRHVLDWVMFSRKHKAEIDWVLFDTLINDYGFRKFYESYFRIGQYLAGEIPETELTKKDKKMISDVWDNLDLHETVRGLKGKISLAGNTWRARWKYKLFSDISMLHALYIQVYGFLFLRHPILK